MKRRTAATDPELFATYRVLAAENSAVAAEHVAALLGQLTTILTDGVATGDFGGTDPAAAARAVFEATASFHHPAHATEWLLPDREDLLADVCTLIVDGLRAPAQRRARRRSPAAPA